MKLEQQVTSLELSKRLRELGVKQESYFTWIDLGMQRGCELSIGGFDKDDVSAFTVAELGEMLPSSIMREQTVYGLACCKHDEEWEILYDNTAIGILKIEMADTEAEARGKMLVYLLENKLITL